MNLEDINVGLNIITRILQEWGYPIVNSTKINGNSMLPTIGDGDFAWYVPMEKKLYDGAIYIADSKRFGIIIKRMKIFNNSYILASDNGSCGYINMPPHEENEDITLVGRVIWILHAV